jgi:putative tricarboxylic transport membrane protein
MKERTTDLLLGAVCLIAGAVYAYIASGIPKSMLSDEVGPGGVPAAVGLAAVVVSLMLIFKSAVAWLKERSSSAAPVSEEAAVESQESPPRSHWLAVALMGLLVAYIAAVPVLGYILSVSILMLVSAALAGHPRNRRLFVFSVSTAVTLFVIFHFVMNIKLPRGIFGF